MAVTFVSAGTATNAANGNVTAPGRPASIVDGDLLLYMLANGDNATITVPANWNNLAFTTSPVSGTALKLTVFWKFFSAGEAMPGVTRGGTTDVYCARVFAYRGVDNVTPFDVTSNDSVNATATSPITWATAITTASANTKVIYCGIKKGLMTGVTNNSSNHATTAIAVPTNANLSAITERAEGGSGQGTDVVYVWGDADRAAAGTTGTQTAAVTGGVTGVSIGAYMALRSGPAPVQPPKRTMVVGGQAPDSVYNRAVMQ